MTDNGIELRALIGEINYLEVPSLSAGGISQNQIGPVTRSLSNESLQLIIEITDVNLPGLSASLTLDQR